MHHPSSVTAERHAAADVGNDDAQISMFEWEPSNIMQQVNDSATASLAWLLCGTHVVKLLSARRHHWRILPCRQFFRQAPITQQR